MILAHSIVGLFPVDNGEVSIYWLVGSVIPDVDHLFVLIKHKIFSWKRIKEVMIDEKKFGLTFKTKYIHSLFGALIMSLPIAFFSMRGALYFFAAYIIHLLLDWPDLDEKQYLYPLQVRFRGFLPIFSFTEKILTLVLGLILLTVFIN